MPEQPMSLIESGVQTGDLQRPDETSKASPTLEEIAAVQWHALLADEVLSRLGSNAHGLSDAQASARLSRWGPNVITMRAGVPWWRRFLLQFNAPLVYILIAAGAVTIAIRDYTDATVILIVVVANAVIGYLQESRAVTAIDALARSMRLEATVRRNGVRRRVDAATLVVGDVVRLEPGDRVPADLRLLSIRDLRTDESTLTGESELVSKSTPPLAPETVLADRRNMVFAGSLVARGTGEGVVVGAGDWTEVGRISGMIASAQDTGTPLTRKITAFSRLLLWLILGVAAATFLVGVARGYPVLDMFKAAVALAVGAIPEGLPAAVTVMLAVGVARMARRRAIIRKLPAVEALGSTTVICSDKTGTLTQNQMTVVTAWVHAPHPGGRGRRYQFSGSGYDPVGTVTAIDAEGPVLLQEMPEAALYQMLLCGALCNDAALLTRGGRWEILGDPTEAALVVSARKGGVVQEEAAERLRRLDAIPFESDRRYMATLHRREGDAAGTGVIFVKGSVERILGMCTNATDEAGRVVSLDHDSVLTSAAALAASGLRVLAFARRELDQVPVDLTHPMVEQAPGGLTFLGLQGMLDPPRPEAINAVSSCLKAGVRVKMITGDHLGTAVAVARMMGIGTEGNNDPRAMTGADMAAIPDEQLPGRAEGTDVFARMTAEQKLRLVKALQARGHIVSMTGDGVNDAPALRQADIGVAMGVAGTEAAKDAADVVLADDNFASIEAAVEEGRAVFANLTKFILWTLPTNVGEAVLIVAAIVLGWPLPILPVHALYINTATAVLLGMPLAFEAGESGVMTRPPRDPKRPLLTFELVMRTGFVSLLLCAGSMGLFHWELGRGVGEAAARTAAVGVIVVGEIFYLFSCRALGRTAWTVSPVSNPWLWPGIGAMLALQVAFAHVPAMNRLFQSAPLDVQAWGRAVAIGVLLLAAVEIEKAARRRAR